MFVLSHPRGSLLKRIQAFILPLAATLAVCGLVCLGWGSPALATGVSQIPTVAAGDGVWVVDEADVLSRLNEGQIGGRLQKLAAATGNEVHFVTFRRLDYGETIESFTDALFNRWFPTPDEQANQVVVALDIATNNAAIHTGEAAQVTLTPDIAASVSQETMMAPIRKGDQYNQAFADASDRLVAVLSGEADPGPPIVVDETRVEGTFASAEETQESNATAIVIVLLILSTVIPMVTYYAYVR
ncbi:MAG: YgcG family protein [Synechococcales cyanobacterium RM1_1_8]|nr:YgcG family protein [Synechococcales cyanobacterium RM1_1_8]